MKNSHTRRFEGDRLVLASHNRGKLAELRALLDPLGISVLSAADAGLEAPDETGETFEENAALKARAAVEATGQPALADDSGLSVDALGGAPGVYSARWAAPDGDHSPAIARVERELGEQDGTARFVCVLALAWPDGHVETARGECHGRLVFPPRGEGGFGYDPIFVPEGAERTFGEMGPDQKRAFSHRSHAMTAMMEKVFVPS
ncbi:RdgB/HAM1 family non-canonical purine NTP pyrophosphatase [Parvularcula dongshanensis]|uniref:dITP/XTP pyrophosphatase n=1 Tax=Parvularcula dongshanensis TaxID=1173995 RepID=A0A840I7F6_9PROT|nr:RdgB/HAM1 family non-canonical purine NTP pyrophosphatase [Parvularcula dongshanensis]MBB4659890.1 XTP/dITP diphosphohydrolase [Parvularcula dongshanensis]